MPRRLLYLIMIRVFGVADRPTSARAPRPRALGGEIAGISQQLMDAFSSRRQTISELAHQFHQESSTLSSIAELIFPA